MSDSLRPQAPLLHLAFRILVVVALTGGVVAGFMASVDRTEVVAEERDTADYASPQNLEADQLQYPRRPSVLVITDSLGGGVGDPSVANYPQILADNFGWDLVLDHQGARGFLPTDLTPVGVDRIVAPFIDRLRYDTETYRADYIVVDGGRNDLGKNPMEVKSAIDTYLVELRAGFPQAKIVVVAPTFIRPDPAENYPQIAEQLRLTAASIGAYVVDPVAEGWFRNVDLAPLLWTDGVHLNAVGSNYYAEKITESIEQYGIADREQASKEIG